MHQWTDKQTRQIKVSRIHDGYMPKYEKYFCIAVLHEAAEAGHPVKDIKINGKSVMDNRTEVLVDVGYKN